MLTRDTHIHSYGAHSGICDCGKEEPCAVSALLGFFLLVIALGLFLLAVPPFVWFIREVFAPQVLVPIDNFLWKWSQYWGM